MVDAIDIIILALTLLVMLVGVIGTVVPVIPGTILIFAAAFIYALLERFEAIGWPTLVALGLLTAVATTADIWASSIGAKMGGASGWSVVAGLVGGLIGLFFFSLPGAIVGAILGVLLTEAFRLRDWGKALKAGSGWAIGWVLATILQLIIGLAMVAIFVWQVMQGP
jgi:uncharacterized protein YqgC (DUF456 family)